MTFKQYLNSIKEDEYTPRLLKEFIYESFKYKKINGLQIYNDLITVEKDFKQDNTTYKYIFSFYKDNKNIWACKFLLLDNLKITAEIQNKFNKTFVKDVFSYTFSFIDKCLSITDYPYEWYFEGDKYHANFYTWIFQNYNKLFPKNMFENLGKYIANKRIELKDNKVKLIFRRVNGFKSYDR
jgi:hypothetical protein